MNNNHVYDMLVVGGGYLVIKVRGKLTRCVDGTLKNYGSLVISSLA